MIPLTRSFKTGGGTGSAVDLDEEELIPKSVAVDDPIVGESMVTLDEHGPGAIEPKVMSAPKELTPHQKARHFISHLPYDPSCEICVACRRPNDPHSLSHESSRTIPLLVGDFGYMRDSKDDDNATILVLKLYPFRLNFACVVASKGPDPLIVSRISKWLTDSGLMHFAYRSDKEPSIVAMIQQACAMAGRNGVHVKTLEDDEAEYSDTPDSTVPIDRAMVAVPEHNHPGESQSNGLSERSIQEVVGQIRTIKMSTESRLGARIPVGHPQMSWLTEHSAYLLNRFQLGTDGRTAYGRMHGKESTQKICVFGERVLWYVPKKHRAKLDARWRYGIFLGRALNSDQNFIGLANGSVTVARAMVRLVLRLRWDMDKAGAISQVPMEVKTQQLNIVEEEHESQAHPEAAKGHDGDRSASRRLRILDHHLKEFGYSDGCPRCNLHRQGLHARAKYIRHGEECRQRIYNAIKATTHGNNPELEQRMEPQMRREPNAQNVETPRLEPHSEPKTPLPEPVPVVDDDEAMIEELPVDRAEQNEAMAGIGDTSDWDDTTDFYKEVDNADAEMQEDAHPNDHEMLAMMDVLQTLGVEPDTANSFAAHIMNVAHKPMRPSCVEFFGTGNIVGAANGRLRNLNIDGLDAFDLRASKPSGEPWDFSKKSDRVLAVDYVKSRKPTWVIGSPPCTAFSRLQSLNFPKMPPGKAAEMNRQGRQHLHFMISIYKLQMDQGRHL